MYYFCKILIEKRIIKREGKITAPKSNLKSFKQLTDPEYPAFQIKQVKHHNEGSGTLIPVSCTNLRKTGTPSKDGGSL